MQEVALWLAGEITVVGSHSGGSLAAEVGTGGQQVLHISGQVDGGGRS